MPILVPAVVVGLTVTLVTPSFGRGILFSRPVEKGSPIGSVGSGDYLYRLSVGGLDRRYTVHVPPGYNGRTATPVVIMLHGGGGTSRAAATETGWGAKADEAGFLAVFPEAMSRNPSRPSRLIGNPQLWNDGSGRFYPGQTAPDDVGFLEAMIDELRAKFVVDDGRIFVTGFSNGASMSFRFAAETSSPIAAIAPVAGACWVESLRSQRPIPMIYITGTADPLNLIEGGVPRLAFGADDAVRAKRKPPVPDSIRKWAGAIGSPATPVTASESDGVRIETYGPGRDGAEVVYITVEGLGHTWAGGQRLLPEVLVGKMSNKIKATDVIWNFFVKHSPPAGKTRGNQ
jgi:polyhydroxybutyrate depolymerase